MAARKMETAVRKGDISSIFNLIAKFANETFAKLPFTYQTVWAVEDLIAYGVSHAVTYVAKEYKNEKYKNAQFVTYLYIALENLYKDLIKEAYTDKRTAVVFSMDTQISHKGQVIEAGQLVSRYADFRTEERLLLRLDAENAFLKVYREASPKLRKHLIHWCIQPKITKYKLSGSQFRLVIKEFRQKEFGKVLTPELIRTIQTDSICRNRVAIDILGVPKIKSVDSRIIVQKQIGGFHTVVRRNKPSLEVQLLADALV